MVLEGGYNMETLVSCATISVKALMGYRNDFLFSDVTKDNLVPKAFDCIMETAQAHKKYWKAAQEFCDKFGKADEE
jgi:acetoin utilization deacetylase AcuC-like enzyme